MSNPNSRKPTIQHEPIKIDNGKVLSDKTRITSVDKSWRELKVAAMVENYEEESWFVNLTSNEK